MHEMIHGFVVHTINNAFDVCLLECITVDDVVGGGVHQEVAIMMTITERADT